jgi:hypothetical protein
MEKQGELAAGSDKLETSTPPKTPKVRSPNYPSINLEDAVGKLPKLFEDMKRHAVGVESAVSSMGLKYTSSTGKLALGAMRAFGLFKDDSKGLVKLSQRALDIAVDYKRDSPEWQAAVEAAALEPAVHKKLRERYGADLPADDELRRYLIRELKFYDNAVGSFIEEYKNTIEFAGLAKTGRNEKNGGNQPLPKTVEVGDYVQWTVSGKGQFDAPRRVLGIVGDSGEWALLEGTETGVPMSELVVQDPPGSEAPIPPAVKSPPPSNPHYKPFAPALKGPSISFPLPNDNTIEIRLAKAISKKDFQKIIKLIELSEDSLVAADQPAT